MDDLKDAKNIDAYREIPALRSVFDRLDRYEAALFDPVTGLREPVHPSSRAEAVRLLRERADAGRRAGFDVTFSKLPRSVQGVLYGIAGQLEAIADFVEADRG